MKQESEQNSLTIPSLQKDSLQYERLKTLRHYVLIGVATLILLPIGDRLTSSLVTFSVNGSVNHCDHTPGLFAKCFDSNLLGFMGAPGQFTGFEYCLIAIAILLTVSLSLHIWRSVSDIKAEMHEDISNHYFYFLSGKINSDDELREVSVSNLVREKTAELTELEEKSSRIRNSINELKSKIAQKQKELSSIVDRSKENQESEVFPTAKHDETSSPNWLKNIFGDFTKKITNHMESLDRNAHVWNLKQDIRVKNERLSHLERKYKSQGMEIKRVQDEAKPSDGRYPLTILKERYKGNIVGVLGQYHRALENLLDADESRIKPEDYASLIKLESELVNCGHQIEQLGVDFPYYKKNKSGSRWLTKILSPRQLSRFTFQSVVSLVSAFLIALSFFYFTFIPKTEELTDQALIGAGLYKVSKEMADNQEEHREQLRNSVDRELVSLQASMELLKQELRNVADAVSKQGINSDEKMAAIDRVSVAFYAEASAVPRNDQASLLTIKQVIDRHATDECSLVNVGIRSYSDSVCIPDSNADQCKVSNIEIANKRTDYVAQLVDQYFNSKKTVKVTKQPIRWSVSEFGEMQKQSGIIDSLYEINFPEISAVARRTDLIVYSTNSCS